MGEGARLSDAAAGFLAEFVDQDLVGPGLFGGHAAKLVKKCWGDAARDETFDIARDGVADAAAWDDSGLVSEFKVES